MVYGLSSPVKRNTHIFIVWSKDSQKSHPADYSVPSSRSPDTKNPSGHGGRFYLSDPVILEQLLT